jgi:type II secretion system protein N
MDRWKKFLFFSGALVWGVFVAVLIIYLFFPYQRALKIALRDIAGGGKTAIAMEGVSVRTMEITASKLSLRPMGNPSQTTPFELSNVDINWSPFSLLRGTLAFNSRASLYDGTLHASVGSIPLAGSGNPNVLLRLEHVNMAKCPDGVFPFLKGVTGTLDGWIRKDAPSAKPDRQTGSFRFDLKLGEVKDLQIKDMPRFVIPYKRIAIQGRMDGPRVDLSTIALVSDVIMLLGKGSIETTDQGQNIDVRLSYEALSKSFPLKGKGTILISGNQAAPSITVSSP